MKQWLVYLMCVRPPSYNEPYWSSERDELSNDENPSEIFIKIKDSTFVLSYEPNKKMHQAQNNHE